MSSLLNSVIETSHKLCCTQNVFCCWLADKALPLTISGFVQVSTSLQWLLTVQKVKPLRYLDLVCTSLFPYIGLNICSLNSHSPSTVYSNFPSAFLLKKTKPFNKRNKYLLREERRGFLSRNLHLTERHKVNSCKTNQQHFFGQPNQIQDSGLNITRHPWSLKKCKPDKFVP